MEERHAGEGLHSCLRRLRLRLLLVRAAGVVPLRRGRGRGQQARRDEREEPADPAEDGDPNHCGR